MGIVSCVQASIIFSFLGSLPVLIADTEPVGYKGQRRTRRWMINVSNKLGEKSYRPREDLNRLGTMAKLSHQKRL